MVSTGVPSLDGVLGSGGYPEKSAILVVGTPSVGKEALGYWFVRSGLMLGDYCLYATHHPVSDVLRDMKGVGVSTDQVPEWLASSGSSTRLDLTKPPSISFNIKQLAHQNRARRVRVTTDILSPLLVLNSVEAMYSYWSQLLSDLKHQDCVIFALVEDGMHPPSTLTTMEQLFDGVIEMRLYEEGFTFTPLFRVKKMLGLPPFRSYFRITLSGSGMEVTPYSIK